MTTIYNFGSVSLAGWFVSIFICDSFIEKQRQRLKYIENFALSLSPNILEHDISDHDDQREMYKIIYLFFLTNTFSIGWLENWDKFLFYCSPIHPPGHTPIQPPELFIFGQTMPFCSFNLINRINQVVSLFFQLDFF